MKGLMKMFSGGLAMWREGRMIGLLRGSYVGESTGSRSVGEAQKR